MHASVGRRQRAHSDLFRGVRTRRAFEDVVQQILELIRSGEITEGDFLPGERTLATAMEVSRPTVRLAVDLLAKAGVVAVHPGRAGGIEVVSAWVPEDILSDQGGALNAADIFETLEARRTLETRVAQLAALRATEEDYSAMQRCIEMQKAAGDADWRKALQADMLFHRRMWQAARNQTLERMMGSIVTKLQVAIDMGMRTGSDQAAAVVIHEHTLAALMRGNMQGIEEAMDEHMSYLEQICEDVFGRSRIREVPTFLTGPSAARAPQVRIAKPAAT